MKKLKYWTLASNILISGYFLNNYLIKDTTPGNTDENEKIKSLIKKRNNNEMWFLKELQDEYNRA